MQLWAWAQGPLCEEFARVGRSYCSRAGGAEKEQKECSAKNIGIYALHMLAAIFAAERKAHSSARGNMCKRAWRQRIQAGLFCPIL